MKTPRGVSGERLARTLVRLGYGITTQKGSHAKLVHPGPPRHSVLVPMHDSLRVGTLHAILTEVARAQSLSMDSIIESI